MLSPNENDVVAELSFHFRQTSFLHQASEFDGPSIHDHKFKATCLRYCLREPSRSMDQLLNVLNIVFCLSQSKNVVGGDCLLQLLCDHTNGD
jgi:hypothetical protein